MASQSVIPASPPPRFAHRIASRLGLCIDPVTFVPGCAQLQDSLRTAML